jgi:CRP/FNR family transcriptional regulator
MELSKVERIVSSQIKIVRGHKVFETGAKFIALYAIRSGVFKSSSIFPDGREQVTGFQMAGEIMGLDGIVHGYHTSNAIALEDSEVCVMNYDFLEVMSREITGLQRHIHKILSREILSDHGVMLLLGSMRAEQRLAAFLLNLVKRLHARGFSSSELILRMTREDIGNYLGMKIETVSRALTKFIEDGVIEVNRRHVRILKMDVLKKLVDL